MAKVAKLNGGVLTLTGLSDRLKISREATHQIVKRSGIDVETPCSRCGSTITLLKGTDATKIEKARAKAAK